MEHLLKMLYWATVCSLILDLPWRCSRRLQGLEENLVLGTWRESPGMLLPGQWLETILGIKTALGQGERQAAGNPCHHVIVSSLAGALWSRILTRMQESSQPPGSAF